MVQGEKEYCERLQLRRPWMGHNGDVSRVTVMNKLSAELPF